MRLPEMRRSVPPMALLVLGAFVLRVVLMSARGDYVMYDEGYYLLLARALREGEGFTLAGLPHVALSPLQPLLVALLSLLGGSLLWTSRILACAASALLVVPVATIGREIGGHRVGGHAALIVAAMPAVMTFLPFFPGESWNLYFGSEPLFLLLAFGATAAAMRAEASRTRSWWTATGALAAGAFLTRGEGVILGSLLFLLLAARLVVRRASPAAWRGWGIGVAAAALCAAPYLVYLRVELGRWAISGRVQGAAAGRASLPAARTEARSGGSGGTDGTSAVEDFVWQGRAEAFWRVAYALDASGTRMASQYWGVSSSAVAPAAAPAPVAAPTVAAPAAAPAPTTILATVAASDPPPRAAATAAARESRAARTLRQLGSGLLAVLPAWILPLALAGFVTHRAGRLACTWLAPALLTALLPSVLLYVEPRVLLPLVPAAAIGVALLLGAVERRVAEKPAARPGTGRAMVLAAPVLALLAVAPALVELGRAWPGDRPLQQVATARRAVAHLLAEQLPPDAIVAAWHPSIAYFADRDWRVLPYEPLDRILGYARAQGVSAIVFSRFEPSPLADPVHPFQVLLLDPSAPPPDPRAPRLATVQETPLVVVRRVLPAGAR